MTASSPRSGDRSTPLVSAFDQLETARSILRAEGLAVVALADQLDASSFGRAAELLFSCRGSVIVSGMGKAGLIGQKIAATLASTGTRSHFLHPAEAFHGDLGRVHQDDLLLILSHSGETEEVIRLLPSLRRAGTPVVAVTGRLHSTLAREATVAIHLGEIAEAGELGLAPSTSTTVMLALGDALALVVSQRRGFSAEDFARFHPGGSLGRKLARVDDLMRPLGLCRVANESSTVREVLVSLGRPERRSGAVLLTDERGHLTGIFTDSDLARLLERQHDAALDRSVSEVMTRSPRTARTGTMMSEAIDLLIERKISELPIVDADDAPVGLIDITDVVGLLPHDDVTVEAAATGDHSADQTVPEIIQFTNRRAKSA